MTPADRLGLRIVARRTFDRHCARRASRTFASNRTMRGPISSCEATLPEPNAASKSVNALPPNLASRRDSRAGRAKRSSAAGRVTAIAGLNSAKISLRLPPLHRQGQPPTGDPHPDRRSGKGPRAPSQCPPEPRRTRPPLAHISADKYAVTSIPAQTSATTGAVQLIGISSPSFPGGPKFTPPAKT